MVRELSEDDKERFKLKLASALVAVGALMHQ
jgi:hypothetical protein